MAVNGAGMLPSSPAAADRQGDVEAFLAGVTAWAREEPMVCGVAVVGSWARGAATDASDLDVVLVVTDPELFLETGWHGQFGRAVDVTEEDWGMVRSRRVTYDDGLEVEFGVTSPGWTRTDPLDGPTADVVAAGMVVLCDPDRRLRQLAEAAAS